MTERGDDGGGPRARSWPMLILSSVAALCLFAMMALTFGDVIARYFFNWPVAGGEEFQSFMLGLIIFSGVPLVTRAERHIAVRSFAALLKGRALFVQRAFVLAATGAGFAFIGYLILEQANTLREEGILSNYLDIPEAPFTYVIAGLTWIAALVALERLVLLFRDGEAETESRDIAASSE